MAPSSSTGQPQPWDYCLRKYLLLLASLVATVTYGVGFSPPGGTWQDSTGGHIVGDPIIRGTSYVRYAVFFYCNTAAFGSSLVVVVLILLLAMMQERKGKEMTIGRMMPLRVVMVLDLLSIMLAYAAGTCRDTLTIIYSSTLVGAVVFYLIYQVLAALSPTKETAAPSLGPVAQASDGTLVNERPRKVVMLLATFAVSVTYAAGLSTPGGFWDSTEEGDRGHRAGDAVLGEHNEARLKAFFVCNTTAFVASLLIIVLLLGKRLREKTVQSCELIYGCIMVALVGLVGAYAAGSSRKIHTTVYVVSLVAAVLLCILLLMILVRCCTSRQEAHNGSSREEQVQNEALDKARSLVLLLATLAATITYQAGLDPPGGLWQDNGVGHIAGDPILLTTNPRRYMAFFYCNSLALVASLVAIVLIQQKLLLKHHVLEAAMVLDLFGLIGAYAAGTCRDVSTSIYVMAMAGAVLVYVVIHVIFFTLDHKLDLDDTNNELVEKRRKRLLLFAILAATITYQAGLTPPGGFLSEDSKSGDHAGDPVLLQNHPHRYMAFFYCNSVSFMLSIALIMLLVNPNLYKPAIRSYALSVCTAAGLFCLMGAYAAGSTQHVTTTISIVVLVAVVSFFLILLLIVFVVKEKLAVAAAVTTPGDESSSSRRSRSQEEEGDESSKEEEEVQVEQDGKNKKTRHAKRKYLMLLGILVASVTYQAGLHPPGGVWQQTDGEHYAGYSVMYDNRSRRYHAFFYCNSISLVASIVVIIILLLPHKLQQEEWWFRVMNMVTVLDLLALLGAYATGSSRDRKTTVYVAALVAAVLGYFVIHLTLSFLSSRPRNQDQDQHAAAAEAGKRRSSC